MKNFSIIVAFDSKYGIGKAGHLPWHLPQDLKNFKEITTTVMDSACQNAVIMGRKTWESLPEKFRPLPGRVNLVLTRGKEKLSLAPGVLDAPSLEDALEKLSLSSIENIFVIGGAEVYTHALKHPLCEKLYITHIQGDHSCDTFFPLISQQFFPISASEPYAQDGCVFHFCTYLRH